MTLLKVLMLAAVTAAACAELMDRETIHDSPGAMEVMYPDMSYIDMGLDAEPSGAPPPPAPSTLQEPSPRVGKYDEQALRRILMYRMVAALRNRDTSPSMLSVPKWIPSNTVLVPPDTFSYSRLKTAMLKRTSSEEAQTRAIAKPNTRLQQKWKIKKGKAGSPMLCYFKLCAFRPS